MNELIQPRTPNITVNVTVNPPATADRNCKLFDLVRGGAILGFESQSGRWRCGLGPNNIILADSLESLIETAHQQALQLGVLKHAS